MSRITRALISVSDKTRVVPFVHALMGFDVQIISTGGTAKVIRDDGYPVTDVSGLTEFPEMLDGRVKTLHPRVHAGILFRRDQQSHQDTIAEHGIEPIDLVVVNLYPFAATVAREGVAEEEAIENIDIGGPAMIRSAAKNHHAVTVVVDPADYDLVIGEMADHSGSTTLETRQRLMVKAIEHTAAYDALIGQYFRRQYLPDDPFPVELTLTYKRQETCRYGENPHQRGAFYRASDVAYPCIAGARQINGKDMSFNNWYDANAALELVKWISRGGKMAVIIKHANPCGAAGGNTIAEAFLRAREADTVSAFGGVLAINTVFDQELASAIVNENNFFEVIVAPDFDPLAVHHLVTGKKWGGNVRLLEVPTLNQPRLVHHAVDLDFKQIQGGLLVQDQDRRELEFYDTCFRLTPTVAAPVFKEVTDLQLAWRLVQHVRSNAIVLVKDGQLVGMGAGQPNRVNSVRLALQQAGKRARGAVMASDAFFPFPDGPEVAIQAGVTAIIQPGGSVKDQETIDLCNKHKVSMVFTGTRHFLH